MVENYPNFMNKVKQYQQVLQNTLDFRVQWVALKELIMSKLSELNEKSKLGAVVELRDDFENMEAIVFDLGIEESGISSRLNHNIKKALVKNRGTLVYQQLFNGKIMVMIQYPSIEGFGEPRQPKIISIYRPDELSEPFIVRHLEEFMQEVLTWEDYDDNAPQKIGFTNHPVLAEQSPPLQG